VAAAAAAAVVLVVWARGAGAQEALSYHAPVIDDWPLAVAPAGYHWAPKPRPWLLDVGLGIWAAAYVPAAAIATLGWKQNGDESYGWQLIPVAGSFLELHFASDPTVRTLLVLDGAMQILGGAVAASAYVFPSRHLERDSTSSARLTVSPMFTGRSTGLTVGGTF
jgi:hypothetical protein